MSQRTLLLSIHPRHVARIFDGSKTVELRRSLPRVEQGDLVLMYATSPVKALIGSFRVDDVLVEQPNGLWNKVQQQAGISREEFDTYYDRAPVGVGIFFSEVNELSEPISLQHLRDVWPGFHPPQAYRYVERDEAELLL